MLVSRVYAMARPALPASEGEAVVRAADRLAPGQSARAMAKAVAGAVVAELIADAARNDPFDRAIYEARQAVAHDPVAALAADPQADLAALLAAERVKAFEARGCVQIGALEWEAETRTIAATIGKRLEERYRKLIRQVGGNYIFSHSGKAPTGPLRPEECPK